MLQFLQNISFYTPEVQTFGNSRTFVMETPRTLIIAQESFGVSKTIAQHFIFWNLQPKMLQQMFGFSKLLGNRYFARTNVFCLYSLFDVGMMQ